VYGGRSPSSGVEEEVRGREGLECSFYHLPSESFSFPPSLTTVPSLVSFIAKIAFDTSTRMSSTDRVGSAGFSRHAIQASSASGSSKLSSSPTPPASSSSGSSAAKSSYIPPAKKPLTVGMGGGPVFERQPVPMIGGGYVPPNQSSGGSPFLFHSASSSSSSHSSSPPTPAASSASHSVKIPRDSPFLPRSSPTRPSPSSFVLPASGLASDFHSAEKAMLDDIGLFRDKQRTQVTVESLLKEKREAEKLAASRAKDMATINSILPTPSLSDSPPASKQSQAQLDMSLITSLTQRLSTLEKIASKQAKSLGQKDVLIFDLQSKVKSVEHSQDAALLYALQKDLNASRAETTALKKQLVEMETFLNDYGLVWVGFRAGAGEGSPIAEDEAKTKEDGMQTGEEGEERSGSPSHPSPAPSLPSSIFFSVPEFLSSVAELNAIASEGNSMRIHTSAAGVTKFLPPISLDLILYRDGMYFRSGPLRPWSLPSAREFIRDVMEGFFPYELKEEFPEGVCLAVVDRSKVECLVEGSGAAGGGNANFTAFKGKGNRLEDGKEVEGASPAPIGDAAGGSPSPSSSPLPSKLTPSPHAPPPIPLDSFLNKLPSHVVQNGKIIEVRGEIGKMLGAGGGGKDGSSSTVTSSSPSPSPSPSSSPSTILVDTPALRLIRSREAATPRQRSALDPLPPITTLQIKLDPSDCSPPLLLKLFYTSTVREVRGLVDVARKGNVQYELRTTYPARNFTAEDGRTLQEAGLTPSASLFARNKRPLSGYRNRANVEQPKPDESWSTALAE
jgi:hypothetical protein